MDVGPGGVGRQAAIRHAEPITGRRQRAIVFALKRPEGNCAKKKRRINHGCHTLGGSPISWRYGHRQCIPARCRGTPEHWPATILCVLSRSDDLTQRFFRHVCNEDAETAGYYSFDSAGCVDTSLLVPLHGWYLAARIDQVQSVQLSK